MTRPNDANRQYLTAIIESFADDNDGVQLDAGTWAKTRRAIAALLSTSGNAQCATFPYRRRDTAGDTAKPVAWIWHYADGHKSLRWRPDYDPTSQDVPSSVSPLYAAHGGRKEKEETAELRSALDRRDESLVTRILNLRAKADRLERELAELSAVNHRLAANQIGLQSAAPPSDAAKRLRDLANAFDPVEGAPSAKEWGVIREAIYAALSSGSERKGP